MAGAGGERVLMIARGDVAGAEVVPGERALLERFLAHVRSVDPDVLTGWNVCDFDLAVLQRACRRAGLRCALGRTDDELEIRRDQSFTRESRAVLCGRVVLDGLALLRSAFIRLEDYRLDTAAKLLIGRRKLFTSEPRGAEIEAAYRDDPARLAAYNLQDARLVLEILERTRLVELAVERSLSTGMQLDRVGAAIASVDSLYLRALRARGRVAPSVRAAESAGAGIVGGLVLDSRPGLYRSILVFDFKSLYPSIIRTFNIDPLTYVPSPGAEPVIRTPGGAAVVREFGCTSHLELEFEKVYARFFMPEVRGGATGSKKRYAGLVVTASGEEIEFVGLEAVRRDWSGVARRFQRVLLDLVFHDRPVADFIRGFVADLRAGRFDGELAYRKAIRKPLAEYTKTTPPHVKAARKQAGATGRIVTYVVTRSGPEAVGETTAPPDYDHYVTQQLRPIADAVLRFLGGPDFDGLTGARRQLTLFP